MSYNSNENYEYVRRVAVEVETIADGAYIGEDGDVISDLDYEGLEDSEKESYEPYSMCDYKSDALDVEYTKSIGCDYIAGVCVYVTLGGPTVWIDTRNRLVCLRWAVDEAECSIGADACAQIEDVISDYLEA